MNRSAGVADDVDEGAALGGGGGGATAADELDDVGAEGAVVPAEGASFREVLPQAAMGASARASVSRRGRAVVDIVASHDSAGWASGVARRGLGGAAGATR